MNLKKRKFVWLLDIYAAARFTRNLFLSSHKFCFNLNLLCFQQDFVFYYQQKFDFYCPKDCIN